MIYSKDRIQVAGPSITDREVELVADAARSAWYANHYAYNARFESSVAEYVGTQFAVSVPHCTAALHLALAAANIGPGDEVIVPDVTWIASVAPVAYVGATPVLVDILRDTWCIDPDAVEAAVTPRTKAVVGVDLYGSMCRWDRLQELADRYDLTLIEDAAEALGSSFRGKRAGSFGKAAAFSFHGSKTVVTGEGGMLVTNDEALWRRVLFLRDHGRSPGDRSFLNEEVAFKYRMSAVQAALGVAQMERIDKLVEYKRHIFALYQKHLGSLQGVTLNVEPSDVVNSFWMVTAILDRDFELDKFQIMAEFDKCNIDVRPFFSPLSTLPPFKNRVECTRNLPLSSAGADIAARGVNLPSGYNMNEQSVATVCQAFQEIIAGR